MLILGSIGKMDYNKCVGKMIGKSNSSVFEFWFGDENENEAYCVKATAINDVSDAEAEAVQNSYKNEITNGEVFHGNEDLGIYGLGPCDFKKDGQRYIGMIMERADMNLEEYFASHTVDNNEFVRIARDILNILVFIHKKSLVHRDFKPSNLMVKILRKSKSILVRLIDHESLWEEGDNKGAKTTEGFCAPEGYKSNANITTAFDMWSFGATLFYLKTGSCPFEENFNYMEPEEIEGVVKKAAFLENKEFLELPRNIRLIISECLRFYPEHRPSAEDCLEYL